MFAIVGTVPDNRFPLVEGKVKLEQDMVLIEGREVPVNRGTPALIAAALKACEILDISGPTVFLVGDIGTGEGSRRLYEYISNNLRHREFNSITFHYLQPDVDWHNKVLFSIEEMRHRPLLIADAGFMYGAKMSGLANSYDLFTPDAGELAFLADEEAPHPFYTRGFILHEQNSVPELIVRAYKHKNASRILVVKGKKDYIADEEGIKAEIDYPYVEALEAIGGTGDTLTGIVSALLAAGYEILHAALIASKVNRVSGFLSNPTPATKITEVIQYIPIALKEILESERSYYEYR